MNSELNAYWKTVVETIQEGVMIVNVDGTIISVNSAFEAITGYPQAEIVGRAIHETGPRKERPFIKVNCAALGVILIAFVAMSHRPKQQCDSVSTTHLDGY